jgi:hypothetical protein
MNQSDWSTLQDYVRTLLKDGKSSKHEDFQTLFRVFGKERVVAMAKEILDQEKKGDTHGKVERS